MTSKLSRRGWLRLLSAAPILPLTASAAELAKTVGTAEGPYYPTPSMRTKDIDNDLVKIEQHVREAGGEVVYLTGLVVDSSSSPLSDLRVEIWQCDALGRYIHTKDRNRSSRDEGFQGFGHTITDESGRYEFRTIKPVPYTGRTPHIHVKVFQDASVLTTQFYLKGHPNNLNDGLFNRMNAAQQAAVEMDFVKQDDKTVATVDIVV